MVWIRAHPNNQNAGNRAHGGAITGRGEDELDSGDIVDDKRRNECQSMRKLKAELTLRWSGLRRLEDGEFGGTESSSGFWPGKSKRRLGGAPVLKKARNGHGKD